MTEKLTMSIEIANLTPAQKVAIEELLFEWQKLGSWGSSRWTAFFADGDGNFRPKILVDGHKPEPSTLAGGEKKRWREQFDERDVYVMDFDSIARAMRPEPPMQNEGTMIIGRDIDQQEVAKIHRRIFSEDGPLSGDPQNISEPFQPKPKIHNCGDELAKHLGVRPSEEFDLTWSKADRKRHAGAQKEIRRQLQCIADGFPPHSQRWYKNAGLPYPMILPGMQEAARKMLASSNEISYDAGGIYEQVGDPISIEIPDKWPWELTEGEPCGHPGCLSHITHPCEGCGRIRGRRPIYNMEDAEAARMKAVGSPEARMKAPLSPEQQRELEIANCPDCQECKRHAYSDATTPGFFYTECEKHRMRSTEGTWDIRSAAGVVIETEMTTAEAKRLFPNWSPEKWKQIADAESEALDATGGLLAVSPEIYAEMQKENDAETHPDTTREEGSVPPGSDGGAESRERDGEGSLRRDDQSPHSPVFSEGRTVEPDREKKIDPRKIPGVKPAKDLAPPVPKKCESCGRGYGLHMKGCKFQKEGDR